MRKHFLFLALLIVPLIYAQEKVVKDFEISNSLVDLSTSEILRLYEKVSPHNAADGQVDIDSAKVLAKSFILKAIISQDSLKIGRGYLMLGTY